MERGEGKGEGAISLDPIWRSRIQYYKWKEEWSKWDFPLLLWPFLPPFLLFLIAPFSLATSIRPLFRFQASRNRFTSLAFPPHYPFEHLQHPFPVPNFSIHSPTVGHEL